MNSVNPQYWEDALVSKNTALSALVSKNTALSVTYYY